MPEEIVEEVEEVEVEETIAEPPTIEELHTFLGKVREAAYVGARNTAILIDEWLKAHPLPEPPPEDDDDEPAAAAAAA